MILKIVLAATLLGTAVVFNGCATTGSAKIDPGPVHSPISPKDVIVYTKPPVGYIKLGEVSATSTTKIPFRGGPLHYATEELKKQAAKMGANGLISISVFYSHYTDTQPAIYSENFGNNKGLHSPSNEIQSSGISSSVEVKDVHLVAIAVMVPEGSGPTAGSKNPPTIHSPEGSPSEGLRSNSSGRPSVQSSASN